MEFEQAHVFIGGGTFSDVYAAYDQGKLVAVKRLRPGSGPNRILREAKLLDELGGHCNVCGLLDIRRNDDTVDLILPYFHHVPFRVRFCGWFPTSF